MRNPGLEVFSAPTMTYERPSNHPIWGDINDDVDPDRQIDEDDEDVSDFARGVNFGRWRNPGQSIHVPAHQGPAFKPGETPEDVIHGEIITEEDHDSAGRIINGDHEGGAASANPYVEHARQDLHTPESTSAVYTLSDLLSGTRPHAMTDEDMEAAHDYLSRHFTGVRVNPHHGTLLAQSPAGTQVARRHQYLPAIPEKPVEVTYSLTNRHGTFKSNDPHRLMRAMVAFQIVHNEISLRQQKQQQQKDDDHQDGIQSTSGLRDVWNYLRPSTAPGASQRSDRSKPRRLDNVPESAVFEPGKGIDLNHRRVPGGYVAPESDAPADWHRDGYGTAYSPGHYMRMLLDPHESMQPRSDAFYPGHTFTYARNDATGHTVPRRSKSGFDYWVRDKVHPSTRGDGFDHPPSPPPPTTKTRPAPSAKKPRRKKTPSPSSPQDPALSLGSGSFPTVQPQDLNDLNRTRIPDWPLVDDEDQNLKREGSVAVNDLCPVCASGYLEPYSKEHHECLNCGSLVTPEPTPVAKPKRAEAAKRPRGGLGRGLKDIQPYEGDPLNLASGGSENPENVVDLDETMAHHPLADEKNQNPDEAYEAPRRILGAVDPDDEIDEHMGKLGFQPIHKPGQSRAYVKPDPHIDGAYYRLTEGVPKADGSPSGWALTADHIPSREKWKQGDKPFPGRSISLERMTKDPRAMKELRQPLPDLQNRVMGDKSFLAGGAHPIDDDALNRAIRDVVQHGRNSQTYQRAIMDTAYEAPRPPAPGPGKTQRDLRGLSSVSNPGLTRFVG